MITEEIVELMQDSSYLSAIREAEKGRGAIKPIPLPDPTDLTEFIASLKQNNTFFDAVLREPLGFYQLTEFLATEYNEESAFFLRDVGTYMSLKSSGERQLMAESIMSRYFYSSYPLSPMGLVLDLRQSREQRAFFLAKAARDQIRSKIPAADSCVSPSVAAAGGGGGSEASESTCVPGTSDATEDYSAHTHADKSASSSRAHTISFTQTLNVSVATVMSVRDRILAHDCTDDLFQGIYERILREIKMDSFNRFLQSAHFLYFCQIKSIEQHSVSLVDFQCFRLLGRGAYGEVQACKKLNTGTLYALKVMNKKRVKHKKAEKLVMREKKIMTMVDSPFVVGLKYAFQTPTDLYLVLDLMMGGDLKYLVREAKQFPEHRAKFYAAEILLGLEALHLHSIVYRDLKPDNILIDSQGHARISDFGIAAILREKNLTGLAGTPGYWAPEMLRKEEYGKWIDLWSYGCTIYELLAGRPPFYVKGDREKQNELTQTKVLEFPETIFSYKAKSLLEGLLNRNVSQRLGNGPNGLQSIKEHPWFADINWTLLASGHIKPPVQPSNETVHAWSQSQIGHGWEKEEEALKKIRLEISDQSHYEGFEYTHSLVLQTEVADMKSKEKAYVASNPPKPTPVRPNKACHCCTLM